MSDLELLQLYARTNSQDAFAALVERHVSLVYSAARRQVRSPQLAEEVTQSVFIDLARQGAQLDPRQPLAAWLFVVTRRTAVDVIRRESRRQAREQAAAEIAAMKTPPSSWSRISEVLDEAMEALDPTDRSALLLRFFENRSLREVGAALRLSEDAAQKRVSRALSRLRSLLDRRGAAAGCVTALATELSAHAVEAAPASLTATLTSTAFVAARAAGSGAASASHAAGWTALQKTAAALGTAGLLGLVAFEAPALARQHVALAEIPGHTARLTATLAELRAAQADLAGRLHSSRATLAEASRPRRVDPELEQAIAAWLARLQRLQTLSTHPDLHTPAFEVLTERDWFIAAKEADLEHEAQIGETFKKLRATARDSLAALLDHAIDRYAAAHDGHLPDSAGELAGYATPPFPPTLLRDYEMLQRGPLRSVPRDAWIVAERAAAAARHGTRVYVSTGQHGVENLASPAPATP